MKRVIIYIDVLGRLSDALVEYILEKDIFRYRNMYEEFEIQIGSKKYIVAYDTYMADKVILTSLDGNRVYPNISQQLSKIFDFDKVIQSVEKERRENYHPKQMAEDLDNHLSELADIHYDNMMMSW